MQSLSSTALAESRLEKVSIGDMSCDQQVNCDKCLSEYSPGEVMWGADLQINVTTDGSSIKESDETWLGVHNI